MRTIHRLLFQREFNTDLYNENHLSFLFQREFNTDLYNENQLSLLFSERVQYWFIQWELFIVFFFSERVQYWFIHWEPYMHLLFQREFRTSLFSIETILIYLKERTIYRLHFWREFNTDLYNENHLSSSFSERVQYWSIQWEPVISFFQRQFNTDLYNENHLSSSFFREISILIYTMRTIYASSFSERVQYWSIQWEPFISFFFFKRVQCELYNENHLSPSIQSERVQCWIQWEPFSLFFFRESSILIYTMRTNYLFIFSEIQYTLILIYTMRTIYSSFSKTFQYSYIQWEPFIVLFFQREFNTDLYNENQLSPFFRDSSILIYTMRSIYRLFFWESSILIYTMRTIYRLLFQREFNDDLYNENHLSSSFSESFQYWYRQWEKFILFFFKWSSILIYTLRTNYLFLFSERVQYWFIQWELFIVFFFRESSILIYTMRTIYRLLFQREFNTDLYNDNHLSSSFSKRVQYWSIQWEPFIVFFFRESSILIYTMRTIYHLLFQKEFNTDLYNENNFSSSFSGRV